MAYRAGGICAKTYSPALLVFALNLLSLALLTIVTFASGTSAPLGSLTVPRRDVVEVWADARMAAERMQLSIHPQCSRFTFVPPEVLSYASPYAVMAGSRLLYCCPC